MDTPPAEELLKKIQELEAGHPHLKQEMWKLLLTSGGTGTGTGSGTSSDGKSFHRHQRSHSISPERSRMGVLRRKTGGGLEGAAAYLKHSLPSLRQSSPLQRESSSRDAPSPRPASPAAVNFTNKQYLNILQSMGQSVHILDLNGRIIYS